MKNKKIRAGVIGLGVGAHQAKTLFYSDKCELISICDFNKNRLSEVGSELKNVEQHVNDKDLLCNPDIDLICIASHDEFHYQQVMMALNNDKHVYVEKPICLKKNEIVDIYNLLKKKPNLKLSSNMVLRTCPLFFKVRNSIIKNNMGSIYHIEADYLWGRKAKLISGWRSEAKFYSIIHGASVHIVDLVLWLTGKKPKTVQAIGSRIVADGTAQKFNDFAILLLEYENQMTVKITAHGGCVHPHFHSLKVYGNKKTFSHDISGTFWINSSNPIHDLEMERAAYPAKSLRKETLESFVNAILNFKDDPLVSSQDVFDVMNICLSAEHAMKTGNKQTIEYL